jgi:signal transduction histidine kinase
MISELLELERLRDGHGIKTARQDVVGIVEDVARNFHDRPPGVRLATMPPEILVDIDADRMRTVIRNLLENAIKRGPRRRVATASVSASRNARRGPRRDYCGRE